jgi:2-polyprenyl-3-methyl-5-hydroxy-6-metoxy-1,4-benzoquinol methylase
MKKNHGQISGFASPLLESIRMKKITSIVKGGDILDYGCGYGIFCEKLPFKTYTGVDSDQSLILYAKQRYSDLKNITFFSTHEFECTDGRYDYIILSAVVEHFRDPMLVLKMLKERLRGNGSMIITTPTHFGNSILKVGSKLGIFSRNAFEEHNQILSEEEFDKIAKNLGLKINKYSTFEMGTNQLVVLSIAD